MAYQWQTCKQHQLVDSERQKSFNVRRTRKAVVEFIDDSNSAHATTSLHGSRSKRIDVSDFNVDRDLV